MTTTTKQRPDPFPIDPLFQPHNLNTAGVDTIRSVYRTFTSALHNLESAVGKEGREMAIVRTHLQEACMMAVRGVAVQEQYQQKKEE